MASWIEGSSKQRLRQYTLPAARREVAEAPQHVAALKAEVARHWAHRSLYPVASYERRAVIRRIKGAMRDLRLYLRQVEWSRDLIAKHGGAR